MDNPESRISSRLLGFSVCPYFELRNLDRVSQDAHFLSIPFEWQVRHEAACSKPTELPNGNIVLNDERVTEPLQHTRLASDSVRHCTSTVAKSDLLRP